MPWIEAGTPPRGAGMRTQPTAQQPQPWYTIRNAASDDEAELLLYEDIGGWFGTYADEFVADLKAVTSPRLRVRLNSPGGSVFEGIAIANALRSHPADVTVQVDGIAASIASVIAMAGDRLIMQPNSMLMIHDASGVCMGNAVDMAKMVEVLDAISDNIAGAYAAKAGGTAADWRDAMRAETWYNAEAAVEAGLADEVGKQRGQADDPEMRKAYDLAAYGYSGPQRQAPKPGPPPPATAPAPTLTIDIAGLLGEEGVEQLRAAVARAAAEPAAADGHSDDGGVDDHAETEPVAVEPPPAAPEPVDDWAADMAGLLADPADDWAADLIHLIGPELSSSAATDA